MRRLKWLVLATAVPPGGALGGVVRYTTELLAALHRREDIDVYALAAKGSGAMLSTLLVGPKRVQELPASLPGPLTAVAEALHPWSAGNRFDVVHGTKHLVPLRTRALRVLTVHDMLLLDRPADFPATKRVLLPEPYRRSIKAADVLACVSAATKARLVAHDADAGARAAVIPLASAAALRDAVPKSVGALEGKHFALVVGDASPRKNLATVLAAWRDVRISCPDAVLAIAGPPDWSASAPEADRADLVREGAVAVLGHVSDRELRWCYEHAAVVLCPSYAEGFGLPAAEALDLGASVIISDDPALQEVAGPRAEAIVPANDQAGWAKVCLAALQRTGRMRPVGVRIRTWDDVAAETVAAAKAELAACPPTAGKHVGPSWS